LDIAVRQPGAARSSRRLISRTIAAAGLMVVFSALMFVAPVSASPQRFASTEQLALRLVNCLRTGGKVTVAGGCLGYGSGRFSKYREPLEFSQKISNKVAAPYAQRIATTGQCRHDLGGTSAEQRMVMVGLRPARYGENLACQWQLSPRRMVIYWIRRWYKETSDGGWHWRQIKDPTFLVAGFGVARHRSGRTSLVIDFYGKPVD
jgi:hypothetical protein